MMDAAQETALLKRARKGDKEAITKILMEYQGLLRNYVARQVPYPFLVDDIAQEAFLAALGSLERVDPKLGIRSYLVGIARNLICRAWRDRIRHREVSGEELFNLIATRLPEDALKDDSDRRMQVLRECMQSLAPRARNIICRHYRDERRCSDIAVEMGTSSVNVRSILNRTRQALKDCMTPKLEASAS